MQQQTFVRELAQAKEAGKTIYYIDESSISCWANIKKKTWSDGSVTLSYQARRGRNHTIIGGLGGTPNYISWISSVVLTTNKETVRQFFVKLLAVACVPKRNLALVMDSHSANRSHYV